jgi:hypothetical protein
MSFHAMTWSLSPLGWSVNRSLADGILGGGGESSAAPTSDLDPAAISASRIAVALRAKRMISASAVERTKGAIERIRTQSLNSPALSVLAESRRFSVMCVTPSQISKEIVVYELAAYG